MPNKKLYYGIDLQQNQITGLPTPTTQQTTAAANVQFVLDNAAGSPIAANVQFTPENNTFPTGTDNVDEALKHLFQSANSGKTAIATAIGAPITSTNTFGEMATAITNEKQDLATFINSAEGTATSTESLANLTGKLSDVRVFKQTVRLGKKTGEQHIIQFDKNINSEQVCVTPYRLNSSTSTTEFSSQFNNGDSTNFIFDNNKVEFTNGVMRIKFLSQTTTDNSPSNGIRSYTVDLSSTNDFRITAIQNNSISYQTIPEPQIIRASGLIDITDVDFLSAINLQLNHAGQNNFRLAISPNGTNYYGYNGDVWELVYSVGSEASHEFMNKGLTQSSATNLRVEDFDLFFNEFGKNEMCFAYYLNQLNFSNLLEVDTITLSGELGGTWFHDYDYANHYFDDLNNRVVFNIQIDATYKFNYIDT